MAQTRIRAAIEDAYDLIRDGGRTPAQLMDDLDVSRTTVQKITTELAAAGAIKKIGTGYQGATIWGAIDADPVDRHIVTNERIGRVATNAGNGRARVLRMVETRAEEGVWPEVLDTLLVTGTGVDATTGHAIIKLQRKDGVTWVLDLEAKVGGV